MLTAVWAISTTMVGSASFSSVGRIAPVRIATRVASLRDGTGCAAGRAVTAVSTAPGLASRFRSRSSGVAAAAVSSIFASRD
jgi:hypothetical protein